ncbi:MAG: FtsX-like permease family protein, partial [Saprospiraceae bacterium]
SEEVISSLANIFAGLTIFISCLGLFGLAAFTADQRIKEIGIRKVLGANTFNIIRLMSGDFIKLLIIALIISFPLAWWGMNKWLEAYPYKIVIGPGIFAFAGITILTITILTVSFQSIKAAMANPMKSLRTE